MYLRACQNYLPERLWLLPPVLRRGDIGFPGFLFE